MQAILFDGSKCAGCQTCAIACKEHFQTPWLNGDEAPFGLLGFQQTTDGNGDALAIEMIEREDSQGHAVWEMSRHGCVHCASAPCKGACPTGAIVVDESTGFVMVDEGRCVNCHLCSVVCPVSAPQHRADNRAVVKCDGCAEVVRSGGVPLCVAACPTGAVAFGDRDELIAQANDRAAALRSQGYELASVIGVDEQGGHQVIQVVKYGVVGSAQEPLAVTGGIPWLPDADVAGPLSVGVLAAGGLCATVALMSELGKQRKAAAMIPTGLVQPCYDDDLQTYPLQIPVDPAWDTTGESGLEAAMRKREMFLARQSTTPAAAAASMTTGAQLFPVDYDFYDGEDDYDGYGVQGAYGAQDVYGMSGGYGCPVPGTYAVPTAESSVSYGSVPGQNAYGMPPAQNGAGPVDPGYGEVPYADEPSL